MNSPSELKSKKLRGSLCIYECKRKNYLFNRFLYDMVGRNWQWNEKRNWTDSQWSYYVEDSHLRTWVAYIKGSPVGYFELQYQINDWVEINYLGLDKGAIGQGRGGYLTTQAILEAWNWGAKKVWVHTCSNDHPAALSNYQARGMKLFRTEESYSNS